MWILLAGIAAILLVLSVGSAANYTSVVLAQSMVYVVPKYAVTWTGTNPDGSLTESGTVTVSMTLTVENPSPRSLRIGLLAYSGWVEDGPAEAGLNVTRQVADDRLIGPSGTRYFMRVFGESTEVSSEPVPAGRNATYRFIYTLTHAANPSRFEALRNITEYASAAAIPVEWNHWLRIQLTIDGVPPASSPTAAPYLFTIDIVEREVGRNLVA